MYEDNGNRLIETVFELYLGFRPIASGQFNYKVLYGRIDATIAVGERSDTAVSEEKGWDFFLFRFDWQ